MSTVAATTAPPTAAAPAADQLIEERIAEACRALWWAELIRESLRMVIVVLAAATIWVVLDQWIYSPAVWLRLVAWAALVGWTLWRVVTRVVPLIGSSIEPAYAARSLERDLPEMKQALTSYVTLRDQREAVGLRSRVVRSIGSRVAGRLKGHDALPVEATGTMSWWLVAAALLALFVLYSALSPKNSMTSVARLLAPLASIDSPKRVTISDVLPGDADAIAGRTLDVSASVVGLRDEEPVWCRLQTASGQQERELRFDETSQRFAGAIELDHTALGKVAYYVEAGDAKAGPFYLSVANVPVVALQSVRYEPPAYTGEVAHTSSSGAITAVDGTKVTIRARTNQSVEEAALEFNPRLLGKDIHGTAGTKSMDIDESGTQLTATFPLRGSRGRSAAVPYESYRIRVVNAAGDENPEPIIYPIRVIADLPPEVSIVMPRKTPKNLPIDGQQVIEVHAMDPDFGLQSVRLDIRRGIHVVAEPSLWSDPKGAKGNQVTEHRFRPTEHGLRVGDVVKVAAVATDNRQVPDDPSIEPNVARTDAVELRIVESEPLPERPEGNDGLSEPDDRPASDDQGQQQSQSDSPSDAGGQGDQGEQGTGGGEGASPKDGDSGGSQSEQSDQNDGTGKNSGQGGKSGDKPQDGSDKNQGDGSTEEENGSGGSGENGSQNNKDSGDGKQQGEGAGGQGDSPDSSNDNQSTGDSPQDSSSTGNQDPSGTGDSPTGDTNQGTGDQDASSPSGDGSSGDNSAQPTGSEQTPGGPKDSPGDGTPSHDAEAFERIKDYLDKKQQQNEGNPQQGEGGSKDQQPPQSDREEPGQADKGQANQSDESPSEGAGRSEKPTPDDAASEQSADGSPASPTDPQTGDASKQSQRGDPRDNGATEQPKPGQDSKTGPESGTDQDSKRGTSKDSQGNQGSESEADSGKQGRQPKDGTGESGRDDASGDQQRGSSDEASSKPQQGSDPKQSSDPQQGTTDQADGKPTGDDSRSSPSPTEALGDDEQKPGEQTPQPSQQDSMGEPSTPPDSGEPTDSDSEPKRQPSDQPPPQGDGPQSRGDSTDPTQSQQSRPPQGSPQASGDGEGTGDSSEGPPPPPTPADLEYTKKATDMVLDYLEETRDKPDQELLEELNWSEEDLKQFAQRWQNIRQSDPSGLPDAETNQDVEQALRSLGMRPKASDTALQNQEQADTLRGLRDSGNRKPPPAAYRDVFEAFRRAVGRQ